MKNLLHSATLLAATAMLTALAHGEETQSRFPRQPVVAGELGARLDEAMRAIEPPASAAVLVALGDEIVLANGYGEARPGMPITIDMPFDIGSMVKPFTAALILDLEGRGLLSLDDTLGDHFDDVPPRSADITLHQLLTHTAGFDAYSGDDFDPVGRDEVVKSVFDMGPVLGANPEWSYSNIGYTLAAVIADRMGDPFERQLHRRFFEPLGMTQTGYVIPHYDRARTPHAFADGVDVGDPLDFTWRDDGPGWNLRGNGGMYSTLHDLYRFWQGLRDGKVLAPEQVDQYFGKQEPLAGGMTRYGDHYGYGWFLDETEWGTRIVQHSGGGPMTSDYRLYPDDDMVIIVLANTWTPVSVALTAALHDVLREARAEQPRVRPNAPELD